MALEAQKGQKTPTRSSQESSFVQACKKHFMISLMIFRHPVSIGGKSHSPESIFCSQAFLCTLARAYDIKQNLEQQWIVKKLRLDCNMIPVKRFAVFKLDCNQRSYINCISEKIFQPRSQMSLRDRYPTLNPKRLMIVR